MSRCGLRSITSSGECLGLRGRSAGCAVWISGARPATTNAAIRILVNGCILSSKLSRAGGRSHEFANVLLTIRFGSGQKMVGCPPSALARQIGFAQRSASVANSFAIISWIVGFHYEVAQSGYDWPAGRRRNGRGTGLKLNHRLVVSRTDSQAIRFRRSQSTGNEI
jgi:hypothetical protein